MNVRSLDLASIAHGFMTGLHYLSEYLAANTQIVLFQMLGLAGQFWDGQKKKGLTLLAGLTCSSDGVTQTKHTYYIKFYFFLRIWL